MQKIRDVLKGKFKTSNLHWLKCATIQVGQSGSTNQIRRQYTYPKSDIVNQILSDSNPIWKLVIPQMVDYIQDYYRLVLNKIDYFSI